MKSRLPEISRARPLLGTLVEIRIGGRREEILHKAASQAFKAIEKVHRLMSFHDPQSDISKLNRLAYRKAVRVHPWTYKVLRTAHRVSEITEGLFDCTVAPLLMRGGFLPDLISSGPSSENNSFRDILFLPLYRIRFKKPLVVDLGGIAKGFAVDRAVQMLKKNKIAYGSVNAGGDLSIFGNRKQPIYIRYPLSPGQFFFLGNKTEISVATSAGYYSKKNIGGKWVVPIVHPKRGSFCPSQSSVSVLASSCMIADALTKAVMLAGPRRPLFLKRFSAKAFVLQPENVPFQKGYSFAA